MAGSEKPTAGPEQRALEANRKAQWTGWQRAHEKALAELQTAEAAYHRLTAEQAFGRGDDASSRAMRLAALTRLEALRIRLDEIRGHQPPWPY